jgi:hypothetical protein
MGNAIDAIYDDMLEVEHDGRKFLDEDFMKGIFSRMYEDSDGNEGPLPPLRDAMEFTFEHKQTPAMDGHKVLPFDTLNAELFYPQREENKDTTKLVHDMAVEVAKCLLQEFRDPKKATSDYLSSDGGKFSWGQTTQEEHVAFLGKMATNDPAESPFAGLTRQLQQFGRMLGIHESTISHARQNGDFKRDIKSPRNNGAFHCLSPEMRESLLLFALKASPEVRKAEKIALDRQRAAKKKKNDMLRAKKMIAAQRKYANALTFIDMYHSNACWSTLTIARRRFSELTSETARKEAVKDQIRLRVIGFGWSDLHHPWSKDGADYSGNDLLDHLIKEIIPQQKKRDIPEAPPVDLPSRGDRVQLGTQTKDVELLDKLYAKEEANFRFEGAALRDDLEDNGEVDKYEKMQGKMPKRDEQLIDTRIEQLWVFTEEDGTKVPEWCRGVVVAIKSGDRVRIEWDDACRRDGDPKFSDEKLLKSKWNKQVERAWRLDLGDV